MVLPLKIIRLTAREALDTIRTLASSNERDGLYLHRAEAGEQVFYAEIEDHLVSVADETPVDLVFYTDSELVQDTIADAIQFTGQWVRQLPDIANGFYAGQGTLNTLVQLGEALAWLQEVSTQLTQRGFDLANWPQRLYSITGELLQVTEGNNASEQADFLLYELQGTLDGFVGRLTSLLVRDGVRE